MANEVSITVSVNNETAAGLEQVVASAVAAGSEAGAALSEGLQAGVEHAPGSIDAGTLLVGSDELATQIADAASIGADEAADAIASGLRAGAQQGAQEASAVIGESFTAPVLEQIDQTGIQAGAAFSSKFADGVQMAEAVKVALTRASLGAVLGDQFTALASPLSSSLTTMLSDASTEAGHAAGGALIGALGDSAAQGAPAASAAVAGAVNGSLSSALETAGEVGAARYAEGLQRGLASVNIPLGGLPIESLSGRQQQADLFVQDPDAISRMVRQSVLAREQALRQSAVEEAASTADAVRSALVEAFGSSGWQISGEQFARLTDAGLAEWRAEVEAQASVVGIGFAQDFAKALREQFSGLDWTTLTDAQAAALTDVLASTAQAAGQNAGRAAGDGLVTGIEAVLASDEAFLSAAAEAGMAQPLINAVQDMRAGIEADLASIPNELIGAFEGIAERFAQEGTQAGTAYALALQEALNAQEGALRAPTQVAASPQYVDLSANIEQWRSLGNAASGEAAGMEKAAAAAETAKSSMGGLAGLMGGPLMQAIWGFSAIAYLPQSITQVFGPLQNWFDSITAGGDRTALSINTFSSQLMNLGQVGSGLTPQITTLSTQLGVASDAVSHFGKGSVEGMQQVDTALANLYQTNPTLATADFNQMAAAMEKQGISAKEVASFFPQYTTAIQNSSLALQAEQTSLAQLVPGTQAWTDAIVKQQLTLQVNAQTSTNATLAALGLNTAQTDLVGGIYKAVDGYTLASGRAQAYQTALTALGDNSKGLLSSTQYLDLFQTTLDAMQPALSAQAMSTGLNAVAALNFGDSEAQLNLTLLDTVDKYTKATSGANAYNTVLTALDGTTQLLLGSEAAFTIALDGVDKAAKSNGLSLDVNNVNGAKNIQTFTQVAQAADKAAGAIYQNEVNTKGSLVAYDDANKKLEDEKQAFISVAEKAGFSKTAVQQLADELFKLPDKKDIPIEADVNPALDALTGLIQQINDSAGYVQIYGNVNGSLDSGGRAYYQADGGPARAAGGGPRGSLTWINEQGAELVRLPSGASVVPHSNVNALAAMGGFGGWDGRVQLEWVGSPDPALDALWTALRGHIRVRGGTGPSSVQTALGQG